MSHCEPLLNLKPLLTLRAALFLAGLTVLPVSAEAESPDAHAGPAVESAELQKRLATIESAIEEERKLLGVQGASLVIVKDDRIVFAKGFGLRDAERNLPVTAETRFAIGSASKSFTAMAAAMAADDGVLSLDDQPKKFLPSFKIADADIDANITLRDLLSHRSGLERTDLVFLLGALTREELIQGIGLLKPVAKLREKFQYQNLMFIAAGEVIGHAENMSYEDFVARRIFAPLGMSATGFSLSDMAIGYYQTDGVSKPAQTFDTRVIAAAGGINSSALDMARWVRFMLGGGVFDGKRLVSEKNFAELLKAQIAAGGKSYYGLGWFLHDWNGHKVVEHGGNVPGFTAQAALMPGERLGFVLLTNASNSPLGTFAMETIWSNLGPGETAKIKRASPETAADLTYEAGFYAMPGGADFTVAIEGSGLRLTVPDQPVYPLEPLGNRRYKLGSPAPAGFFATFRRARNAPSGIEMFLEQPQGNMVLPKRIEKPLTERAAALAELIATYKSAAGETAEIANIDGEVALVVPGQPAYPLKEKAKDLLSLGGLPAGRWSMSVHRDAGGNIGGFLLDQPNGKFEFVSAAIGKPDITVEELLKRAIDAAGGETTLRSHRTSVAECEIEFEGQGITGRCTAYNSAPESSALDITLSAFGKPLATTRQYFDGETGGTQKGNEPPEPYSAKMIENIKPESQFQELLRWRELYKEVVIKGKQRLGGEEAYVVVKMLASGSQITDYYSTKTFLQLRHDSLEWSDELNQGMPTQITMHDYRASGGVMIPFTVIASGGLTPGKRIIRLRDVRWDVPIGGETFRMK
jgi:CubicO group peptidase (beta-lactamase class C family)